MILVLFKFFMGLISIVAMTPFMIVGFFWGIICCGFRAGFDCYIKVLGRLSDNEIKKVKEVE